MKSKTWLLRFAVAVILIMHSIPGMLDGGVYNFGKFFLANKGFGVLGIPLAWIIKLSHVACALAFIFNRYINISCIVTIIILSMGIAMVHFKEGWFVVGAGRNGVEFNFLLIVVLIYLMQFDQPIISGKKGKR
jgi:putative oxidoreductase